MNPTCELCAKEPSILAATGKQIAIGESCYGKLLGVNASWAPETLLQEIQDLTRLETPREVRVSSPDT